MVRWWVRYCYINVYIYTQDMCFKGSCAEACLCLALASMPSYLHTYIFNTTSIRTVRPRQEGDGAGDGDGVVGDDGGHALHVCGEVAV